MNVSEKFLALLVLAILASGFIVISSIPKKSAMRAAFVVLVDEKTETVPEQQYPQVDSEASLKYKEVMAKTLLEYNR